MTNPASPSSIPSAKEWPKYTQAGHLITTALALAALLLLLIGALGFKNLFAAQGSQNLTVRFSHPSGYYDQAINLKMNTSQNDALIYFSTDGSIPSPENGTLYTKPLHLPAEPPRTAVVRAAAFLANGESSPVQSATYFLGLDADLPLVSLIISPEDLWDETNGIYAQPGFTGRDWERDVQIFFYEPQTGSGFQAPAGIRIHGTGSRRYEKKSLRLYFRNEYGLPAVDYPLFPDSERRLFKRLVLHSGGNDFPAISLSGTLLRNQLIGNLARKIDAYASYTRPILLYINGEPWGIYNLRERIDDRYLQENFNIHDADLLDGFEHDLNISAGDRSHWDNLLQFATTNDLRDPDNYAYLQTQINMDNYIDYLAFQFITANTDWPRNNQLKFRDRATGRWHWMFWDSDYAFGLLPDSYIEKDMFLHVLENEGEREQEAGVLFNQLFANPQFKAQFLSRTADMLNTVFLPEDVLAEIDALAAALEKDIGQETRRWPGGGEWQAGVDYMREFARRRPEIMRDQAVAYFNLPGTALLRIELPPDGQGAVSVNGRIHLQPDDLPWEGTYFQGVDLQLTAVPAPGFHFSGWDPPQLPQTQSITISLTGDTAVTPRFAANEEDMPRAGDVRIVGYGLDGRAPVDGLEGQWVELQIDHFPGVNLRGWRLTDNDSKTAMDEGSLIIGGHEALSAVPPGTAVLIVTTQSAANDRLFPEDDLSAADGRIILYAGNENLDSDSDPWFSLGPADNLVLLAPGPTAAFADDLAIDFLSIGHSTTPVTPADFGLLSSGSS